MTLIEELESIFAEFDTSLEEAKSKLKGVSELAYNLQGLLHHLYFAMASLITKDVKNVLELGTGLGQTTAVLSKLFPTANIYTLDLPESDKDYKIAWRNLKKKKNAMVKFKHNINRENIVYIDKNSFFLPSLELPEKFEMIWVDGGHRLPDVAWDIMFSYNHLQRGGFMLLHDYSVTPSERSQVKNVLDYISSRIKEKVWLFPSVGNENAKTACIRKES